MTDQPQSSATVRRMLVGAQLRSLREARGITREEAGYTIRASESKMSRLELGRVSFKERDISDLLMYYGVTDPEQRDKLLRLAREANRRGWWRDYEDVLPSWFENYIGLEEAATAIRTYEIQFVPGLLQTEDYARTVIATSLPPPNKQELDRSVSLRATRQRVLTRKNPLHFWAMVDEMALRRPIGPRSHRRSQLRYLLEMLDMKNVVLQALPFRAGSHAAGGGAFSLLRFSEEDMPDVVYVELLASALYLDKREHVDRYTEVMNRLSVDALTPEATVDLLRGILAEL